MVRALPHNALYLFFVQLKEFLVGRRLNRWIRQEDLHWAGFREQITESGALRIQAGLRYENVEVVLAPGLDLDDHVRAHVAIEHPAPCLIHDEHLQARYLAGIVTMASNLRVT